MPNEWISKKELLIETQISYGQLYRWKRKGLIPETWFIRRSTFTGQETFFPRAAILERIHWIQSMKPDTPLDDLAERIHEPSSSGPEWPLDVLWEQGHFSSLPPIDSDHSMNVREHDFVALVIVHDLYRQGLPREILPDALAFVKTMPSPWLEEPQAILYGLHLQGHWLFMVATSPNSLWLGTEAAPLAVSIAQTRSKAREIWHRVTELFQSLDNRDS